MEKFKQANKEIFDLALGKYAKSSLSNERIRICEPEIIEIFANGQVIARIVDNSLYDKPDEYFVAIDEVTN